ncbi:hypothetical protein [Streptomyces sp. NPDC007100]|uniref:hypothetical protein n=1 Tax=Streptomyces sp. NPDC007100 TaxID=3155602 RepID=UPI0033C669FB
MSSAAGARPCWKPRTELRDREALKVGTLACEIAFDQWIGTDNKEGSVPPARQALAEVRAAGAAC